MTVGDKIVATVRLVTQKLVEKDYGFLESLSGGVRLSADDMSLAVEGYGRTLIVPPPNTEYFEVVETEGDLPRRWAITLDLWSMEEGRSDLSVVLTIIESESEIMDVEVDDILVL